MLLFELSSVRRLYYNNVNYYNVILIFRRRYGIYDKRLNVINYY